MRTSSARLGLIVVFITAFTVPSNAQTLVGTITRPDLEPTAMVLDESRDRLIIADYTSKNIFIYDATTLSEVRSILTTMEAITDLVIDEPSGKLYASCFCIGRSGVTVIDTVGGTVLGTVATDTITKLAQNPALRKVYALHRFGFMEIDPVTDATRSISAIGSNMLRQIAVNQTTNEIFISTTQFDHLDVVDGVSFAHTTVPGLSGYGVAVNPLRNKVYIAYNWKIYNRQTGIITPMSHGNDATELIYNPASDRIYSSAEVNHATTIINGADDTFFTFPLATATAMAVRNSTNHLYFTQSGAIGVLDDATQALALVPMPPRTSSSPSFDWNTDQILVRQSTGRVYVINNSNNNNIAVLEDTERFTRPILYIGSKGSFRFHLLDSATLTPLTTYSQNNPHGFALRADGGRVYSAQAGYFLVLAGTGNFPIVDQIPLSRYDPVVTVVSPDATRAYVTDMTANHVSVVDLISRSATTIPVGRRPWGAAISPDGSKLYVANQTDGTVSVIATEDEMVVATIPVAAAPWGMALNPAATRLYVANASGNTVSVIDTATDRAVRTIAVGQRPHWVVFSPDGRRAFVSNFDSGTVSEIDTGTDSVVRTLAAGANPEGLVVTPDGNLLHVLNSNMTGASTLSSLTLSTGERSMTTLPDDSRQSIGVAIADTGARFAGRVTASGCGVGGATLRVLQASVEVGRATTNEAGDYAVPGLRPGTYDLELSGAQITPELRTDLSVAPGRTVIAHFAASGPPGCARGDVNGDGAVTVADVIYLIEYLFAAGADPLGSADADSDGSVTIADVFYLINYLFFGGPAPVP